MYQPGHGRFADPDLAASLGLRAASVGDATRRITALTGRVIPPRSLPYAVHVVVQNVATAAAVHDAVRFRRPLLDRVVTVTGPGVVQPRNVRAPIGTPTWCASAAAWPGGPRA